MAQEERITSVDEAIEEARGSLDNARAAVIAVDAEIQKKENEIKTASAIGERDISNLERQAQDASSYNTQRTRQFQNSAAKRRSELADRINQLESQLGALRNKRIEVGATQTAQEARLADLQERVRERTERESISETQIERAAELEQRLSQIESERADLVEQIERYAPIVEAQREAATASGSA